VTRLERQQYDLRALASLGTALRRCRSREEMLDRLVGAVLDAVEADGAALAVYEKEGDEVVFELGLGVLTPWTGRRIPASASVSATVIATGAPWATDDAPHQRGLSQRDLPAGMTAYASIPVWTHDAVMGALVVTRTSTFVDKEVQVLTAIGELAGFAVQHHVLNEQLASAAAALEETLERTIEAWARAVEVRDMITAGHTQRVTELTLRLARLVGVPEGEMPHLRRGAMLHDVGKILVPDYILQKPGPLTADERAVMRQHVDHAYAMLGPIEFLRPALEIPTFHHECWDGSGYPRGLRGETIPLSARIFAPVDAYDAMTSDRPYHARESGEDALRYIMSRSGREFDPRVVEAMLTLVTENAL